MIAAAPAPAPGPEHDIPADDFAVPDPATHILIVDDDRAICAAYDEILRARGYVVETAGSRAEALAKIEAAGGRVDILLMDISLPDTDGSTLVREITDRIGLRPALYMSGWTDEFWDLSDAPGRWLVMQKPIPIPRLIAGVEWLTGKTTRPPG